jgi:sugar lactone lactonase YvrE
MLRFTRRGLGAFLALFFVLNEVGCGGSPTPSLGSTTVPIQTTAQVVTAIVNVNVTSGQVTVKPAASSARTVFTGSTLSMTTLALYNQVGSTGNKTTQVSITNNSSLPIGIDPNGNVTGIRVIFGAFTITGGSSPDPVQLSNPTGVIPTASSSTSLPYISFPGQIAPNKTSPPQNWNFTVPSGVTAFSVPVTLEADNSFLAQSQSASGTGSTSTYVRTLAGGPRNGYTNGSGSEALFASFLGIAVDAANNVYVADDLNNSIRRVTPSGSVSTIAGNSFTTGFTDGAGDVATFSNPIGVAVTPDGLTVYVTDFENNAIRRITISSSLDPTNPANWMVSTIAGTGAAGGTYLSSLGTLATLNGPAGIALDAGGNLYFSELQGNRVRGLTYLGGDPRSSSSWEVVLLAGDLSAAAGTPGDTDATGEAATFRQPVQIATDLTGNAYVADTGNNRIRKITSGGVVSTFAGGTSGSSVVPGYHDGPAATALFHGAEGVAVDKSGLVYVADAGNGRIRAITQAGNVSTLAGAGSGTYLDGAGTVAQFPLPSNLAVTSSGSLFVGDGSEIRLVERINSQ